MYLIGADKVDDDGSVGDVEEPVWVVEAKASKEVSWSIVAKGGVTHASAQHVEDCGHCHAEERRLLHHLRLRWRRSPYCVLG